MKIETILNAMIKVNNNLILVGLHHHKHLANLRQYYAFRDRMLRMGNDSEEAYYNGVNVGLELMDTTIAEKDAEIYMLTEDLEKESP